jgi:hypothetical protein
MPDRVTTIPKRIARRYQASGIGVRARDRKSKNDITTMNAPAADASERCGFTMLPKSPMVMPLNARRSRRPTHRERDGRRCARLQNSCAATLE